MLKLGSTGPEVARLQEALGVPHPDGIFGTMTDATLRAFQANHGLTADGIAGPLTLAALGIVQPAPAPASTDHRHVARARSAIGKGIRYGLGKGGLHPLDPLPARMCARVVNGSPVRALWCDCSGFVAWVIGRTRKPTPDFGLWLSTDAIYADARGPQRLFAPCQPEIGCLVVYPDHGGRQGHIGVVTGTVGGLRIVDCSSSQGGITERAGDFFMRNPRVVFCKYKAAA